jgi:hypothetical protein
MNCWGISIYFTKSRFSLNGGLFVYVELLSGHEKIITKSGISLNAVTLNRGFTVFKYGWTIMTDAEHLGLLSISTVILGDKKACKMVMCIEMQGDCVGKS